MDYVLIIILFFLVFRNRNDIEELKKENSRLRGLSGENTQQQEQHQSSENYHNEENSYGTTPQTQTAVASNEPSLVTNIIEWLKVDFFVKLGALLLLIGFGWFVTYAFANNWIGPIGRIVLGLVTGVGVMLLGTWRIKNFANQGAIFTVLGSGITLMTVFAAQYLYEMFTPALALVIMFMAVAYTAFVSVVYKNNSMAFISLLLAGLVPVLTASVDPNVFGLFSYLAVVVVGTLWVVRLTGNHILTLTASAITLVYSLPFFDLFSSTNDTDTQIAFLFSIFFALVFLVFNTISVLQSASAVARRAQLATATLTGFYILLWVIFAVDEDWMSLVFVAWMLLFSFSTFAIYTHTNNRVPFYLYGAVSTVFLFVATAAELAGVGEGVLAMTYTIEVTAILMVAAKIMPLGIARKLSVIYILPILMSFESLDWYIWRDSPFGSHFLVLLFLIVSLVSVSVMFKKLKMEPELETGKSHKNVTTERVLLVLASLYAIALVWLSLHASLAVETATFLSLSIYTIAGLYLFIKGRMTEAKGAVYGGAILIGAVTLRLLLIDLWSMDLAMRIVTLFVIGVLLISTAFIGNNNKKEHYVND